MILDKGLNMSDENIKRLLHSIEQQGYELRSLLKQHELSYKAETIVTLVHDIKLRLFEKEDIREQGTKKQVLLG
jgi:hypothetical protein